MKPGDIARLLKILSPVAAAFFIFLAALLYQKEPREGSAELLADSDYVIRFVADAASAKENIYCSMYMFKFDEYRKNNLQEPTALLAAALTGAAKRGVDVAIMMDTGRPDELTTKYNEETGQYLKKNGIRVMFDSPKRRLHSKMCLIDGSILYIGSHNFTFSAMSRNSETSARIVSKGLGEDAKKYYKGLGLL